MNQDSVNEVLIVETVPMTEAMKNQAIGRILRNTTVADSEYMSHNIDTRNAGTMEMLPHNEYHAKVDVIKHIVSKTKEHLLFSDLAPEEQLVKFEEWLMNWKLEPLQDLANKLDKDECSIVHDVDMGWHIYTRFNLKPTESIVVQ